MRDPASAEGQIVSDRQALRDGKTEVELWLEKISAAKLEEKDWRESAHKAVSVYEAGKDQNSAFNIYHANVETIVPALYNSTPIPDVRRRYDPEPIDPSEFAGLPPEQAEAAMQQAQQQMDAIGKAHRTVAELTERGLSYSVDGYDFDDVIEDAVRDAAVTGRGVVRLRYLPEVEQTEQGPKLIGEDLRCELVPWNRFRSSALARTGENLKIWSLMSP